jgi:hypothetical protein
MIFKRKITVKRGNLGHLRQTWDGGGFLQKKHISDSMGIRRLNIGLFCFQETLLCRKTEIRTCFLGSFCFKNQKLNLNFSKNVISHILAQYEPRLVFDNEPNMSLCNKITQESNKT